MPRKKIEDQQEEALEWDKKRIAIAFAVVGLLIVGAIFAKRYILGSSQDTTPTQSVQGIHTQNSGSNNSLNFSLPTSGDIQAKLGELEQKVTHLTAADVASSSPQVRDIIQQIQNLPNLPKDQAKSVCEKVCGSYMK